MKNILLCLSIICFLSSLNYAQNAYSLKHNRDKLSMNAATKIKEILVKNLKGIAIKDNSIITLEPAVSIKNSGKIEGMETRNVAKATISFKIADQILGIDTSIKINYETVEKNNADIESDILSKLSMNNNLLNNLQQILTIYSERSKSNCAEYIRITTEKNKENSKEFLSQLLKLKNTVNCPETENLIKEVTNKINTEVCTKNLYEAQIMINSGNKYQINKAVELLLGIPPTANCKDDALKLSKSIPESMLNAEITNLMNTFNTSLESNNLESWYQLQSRN